MDPDQREQVTREVFALLDADKNGVVEREEWMAACEAGVRLPDFGVSVGGSLGADGGAGEGRRSEEMGWMGWPWHGN